MMPPFVISINGEAVKIVDVRIQPDGRQMCITEYGDGLVFSAEEIVAMKCTCIGTCVAKGCPVHGNRVFPGLDDLMELTPAPDWQGNCEHCGHRYAATDRDCPKCGGQLPAPTKPVVGVDYARGYDYTAAMLTCAVDPNVPMPGWIPQGFSGRMR